LKVKVPLFSALYYNMKQILTFKTGVSSEFHPHQ